MVVIFPGVRIGSPPSLSRDRFYGFFLPSGWKKKPSKNLKIIGIKIFQKYCRYGDFCDFDHFFGFWDDFFFPPEGEKKIRSNPSSLPIFRFDRQNYMCTPGNKKTIPLCVGVALTPFKTNLS